MRAGAAFKYIGDVLDEAQLSDERSAAFKAAVLGSIPDLTRNEPFEAAILVLERFSEDHAAVVASLSAQPELQYKYLQAASQVGLQFHSGSNLSLPLHWPTGLAGCISKCKTWPTNCARC